MIQYRVTKQPPAVGGFSIRLAKRISRVKDPPTLLIACIFISLLVLPAFSLPTPTPAVVADKNSDTQVDAKDLLMLLEEWRAGEMDLMDMAPISQSWYHSTGTSTNTPTPPPLALTATPTPQDESLFYYYIGDVTVPLVASQTRIGVGFLEGVPLQERSAFVADYSSLSHFVDGITGDDKVYRVELNESLPLNDLLDFLDSLAEDARVAFVTPVFPWQDGVDMMLDITFVVGFNPDVTDEEIAALNEANGVEIVESGRPAHRHGRFLLKPSEGRELHTEVLFPHHWRNAVTTLHLANLYHENPLTEYSTPNFYRTNLLQNAVTLRAYPNISLEGAPSAR